MGHFLCPCRILRNHSAIHDFSALKFAVPVAVVVFCLLPFIVWLAVMAIAERSSYCTGRVWVRRVGVAWATVWLAMAFLYAWPLRYKMHQYFPLPDKRMAVVGRFIDTHTDYRDVVFSTNYKITDNPPQALSYSMKLVHNVDSLAQLLNQMDRIRGDFRIVFFELNDGVAKPAWLRGLLRDASETITRSGFTFSRIPTAAVRHYARIPPAAVK